MEKFLKLKITTVCFLALAFFAFAGIGQAKASGDFDIQFSGEPGPMFNVSNFLPGDSVSGSATVHNASSLAKKAVVWTDNIINPKNGQDVKLGNILTMSIARQGEPPFYRETLTKFLNDTDNASSIFDEYVVLENSLPSQTSKTYIFKIDFDINAGNEYQAAIAGFDLKIGSQSDFDNNTPSTKSFLSTGGGSAPLIELEITNVREENIQESASTISWDTNEPATTQIIYSRHDQPHTLTGNAPYYGYAGIYPVPEDPNFVYHHQVSLNGLTPCSTYYYRVVSHTQGKGDTVSRPEQSFTTLCSQGLEKESFGDFQQNSNNYSGDFQEFNNNPGTRLNGSLITDGQPDEQNEEPQNEQKGEEKENKKEKKGFNLLASLASIWDNLGFNAYWPDFPWWIFLLFAVYPLIKALNHWNEKRKKRSLIFFLLSLIPIIAAVWAYLKCLPWQLFIIFLMVSAFVWLIDRPKKYS